MDEKKIKNPEGVRQLTDEEVEAVNGGMKIIVHDKPKFIQTILKLIFNIKKKKR